MSDKKLAAKKEMLQKMSKDLREDAHKGIGEDLKTKKLSKVTVMAPDDKSLAKGLSKAQELIKAKFGEKGLEEDTMDELDEEAEETCPECDGEGCEACEYEDETEDSEEEAE
jgi:predicted methyltransferase